MTTRRSSAAASVALVALPLLFLGYFFGYPLVTILTTGFAPGGELDLGPLQEVLTSPSLRGVAWFTLDQALDILTFEGERSVVRHAATRLLTEDPDDPAFC